MVSALQKIDSSIQNNLCNKRRERKREIWRVDSNKKLFRKDIPSWEAQNQASSTTPCCSGERKYVLVIFFFSFFWISSFLFPLGFEPETSHKSSLTLHYLSQASKACFFFFGESFSCSIWSSVLASDTGKHIILSMMT